MAPLTPAPRPLRRSLALLVLAWMGMTGGVFGGCGSLFDPATPEPPAGDPIVPHYETIELTLRTMEEGIEAKAGGIDAWMGAFDPASYRQLFDERDISDRERDCACEAPTEWGYLAEQNSYLSLVEIRPGDTYVAEFNPFDEKGAEPPPGPDGTIIYRHYRIIANTPDGNSTQVLATGTVDLTLKEIAGNWLITSWIDRRDSLATADQLSMGMRRLESTTQ